METYGHRQLHMIKFSVLKYSIIYSLMAQTTLAVQTVARVSGSGEGKYTDSPVYGVHVHSAVYNSPARGPLDLVAYILLDPLEIFGKWLSQD